MFRPALIQGPSSGNGGCLSKHTTVPVYTCPLPTFYKTSIAASAASSTSSDAAGSEPLGAALPQAGRTPPFRLPRMRRRSAVQSAIAHEQPSKASSTGSHAADSVQPASGGVPSDAAAADQARYEAWQAQTSSSSSSSSSADSTAGSTAPTATSTEPAGGIQLGPAHISDIPQVLRNLPGMSGGPPASAQDLLEAVQKLHRQDVLQIAVEVQVLLQRDTTSGPARCFLLDYETTTLGPLGWMKDPKAQPGKAKTIAIRRRPCQVSLMDWQTREEYNSMVHPGDYIHPDASAVHHFTDADVADAPSTHSVGLAMVLWIWQRVNAAGRGRVVLVAHMASFDIAVLTNQLLDIGVLLPWGWYALCTKGAINALIKPQECKMKWLVSHLLPNGTQDLVAQGGAPNAAPLQQAAAVTATASTDAEEADAEGRLHDAVQDVHALRAVLEVVLQQSQGTRDLHKAVASDFHGACFQDGSFFAKDMSIENARKKIVMSLLASKFSEDVAMADRIHCVLQELERLLGDPYPLQWFQNRAANLQEELQAKAFRRRKQQAGEWLPSASVVLPQEQAVRHVQLRHLRPRVSAEQLLQMNNPAAAGAAPAAASPGLAAPAATAAAAPGPAAPAATAAGPPGPAAPAETAAGSPGSAASAAAPPGLAAATAGPIGPSTTSDAGQSPAPAAVPAASAPPSAPAPVPPPAAAAAAGQESTATAELVSVPASAAGAGSTAPTAPPAAAAAADMAAAQAASSLPQQLPRKRSAELSWLRAGMHMTIPASCSTPRGMVMVQVQLPDGSKGGFDAFVWSSNWHVEVYVSATSNPGSAPDGMGSAGQLVAQVVVEGRPVIDNLIVPAACLPATGTVQVEVLYRDPLPAPASSSTSTNATTSSTSTGSSTATVASDPISPSPTNSDSSIRPSSSDSKPIAAQVPATAAAGTSTASTGTTKRAKTAATAKTATAAKANGSKKKARTRKTTMAATSTTTTRRKAAASIGTTTPKRSRKAAAAASTTQASRSHQAATATSANTSTRSTSKSVASPSTEASAAAGNAVIGDPASGTRSSTKKRAASSGVQKAAAASKLGTGAMRGKVTGVKQAIAAAGGAVLDIVRSQGRPVIGSSLLDYRQQDKAWELQQMQQRQQQPEVAKKRRAFHQVQRGSVRERLYLGMYSGEEEKEGLYSKYSEYLALPSMEARRRHTGLPAKTYDSLDMVYGWDKEPGWQPRQE